MQTPRAPQKHPRARIRALAGGLTGPCCKTADRWPSRHQDHGGWGARAAGVGGRPGGGGAGQVPWACGVPRGFAQEGPSTWHGMKAPRFPRGVHRTDPALSRELGLQRLPAAPPSFPLPFGEPLGVDVKAVLCLQGRTRWVLWGGRGHPPPASLAASAEGRAQAGLRVALPARCRSGSARARGLHQGQATGTQTGCPRRLGS